MKVNDIVPYINTHGNQCEAKVTEITDTRSKKGYWFKGVDTKTGAKVFYPIWKSDLLKEEIYAENKAKNQEITIKGFVARDKKLCKELNTNLWLYQEEPTKEDDSWRGRDAFYLPEEAFPYVKWIDDEPTEVRITIKVN